MAIDKVRPRVGGLGRDTGDAIGGSSRDLESGIFPDAEPDDETLMNLPPSWLLRALKLYATVAPDRLTDFSIQPVIDAYQNGWGVSVFPTVVLVQPAGTASQTLDVSRAAINLTPAASLEPYVQRVIGITYASTIVAAGSVVILQAAKGNTIYQIARTTLGANPSTLSTRDILGFDVTIPPGYDLQIVAPVTAGGETVTFTVCLQVAPAGFSL